MSHQEFETASEELKKEIRDVAIGQVSKWVIGSVVFLLALAAAGWWLYLEPRIREYIISAGGIPPGAIVASQKECSKLSGTWSTFSEGTGRVMIGAGTEYQAAYEKWDQILPNGGVNPISLTKYSLLQKGGEEAHILSLPEMPKHDHSKAPFVFLLKRDGQFTLKVPDETGGEPNLHTAGEILPEGDFQPHNNMPPFVALYFCRKEG
jgi:hypothetical protein